MKAPQKKGRKRGKGKNHKLGLLGRWINFYDAEYSFIETLCIYRAHNTVITVYKIKFLSLVLKTER